MISVKGVRMFLFSPLLALGLLIAPPGLPADGAPEAPARSAGPATAPLGGVPGPRTAFAQETCDIEVCLEVDLVIIRARVCATKEVDC